MIAYYVNLLVDVQKMLTCLKENEKRSEMKIEVLFVTTRLTGLSKLNCSYSIAS